MLVGRQGERAAIAARLESAKAGRGSALTLRGDAGIGKTALLAWAREQAGGERVLEACGCEAEAHLPFAALLQLVDPLLALRTALPEPQRAALEGSLALAPASPGDRFTVFVAVLGLLRLAAEQQPLLVIVDDAQWIDGASLECVAFVARRLQTLRATMLLAVRDGEASLPGLDALESLPLPPLGDADAHALVAGAAGDLVASVRDAVVGAAEGNPLALVEIASSLAPAERSGLAPLPAAFPTSSRLASLFERRVAALDPPAEAVLRIAAVCDSGRIDIIERACASAGLDAALLEDAERAGILRIAERRVRFTHPLLRSSAWHRAGGPERRAAHRALADVVEGDRRAWHLAESALGTDEAAAEALAQAAANAAARRAYADASLAYERAASLDADPDRKARRLLRACNTCVAAGQMQRALELLDAAAALGAPVSFSPRTLHTRCLLLLGLGQVDSATSLLRSLAEAAATTGDAVTAAYVTADAGMAALLAGDVRAVLEFGRTATALLDGRGDALVRAQVGACLASGLVFRGEWSEGRQVLEAVERIVVQVQDQELALRTHSMITHLRNALDDYETALAHATGVLESLDRISAHAARAAPLGHAADAAHRLGQWDLADALTNEAITVAEETANGDALPRALIMRARISAARGQFDVARGAVARTRAMIEGYGNLTMESYVLCAEGLLALSAGSIDEAIATLERVDDVTVQRAGLRHPSILPWRADLVEACVRSGATKKARMALDGLDDEVTASGSPVGAAMAARCSALLASDEEFAEGFERALALESMRPMPFERARTLLLYGARLHRAKQRARARERLREAEAIFEGLGALPWRDRAREELAAAGARRRDATPRASGELTEQELRVATAIARGLTVKEVAASLFLSPKTVDSHLQQVYSKLDVHSRAKLALVAAERGWV